MANIPSQPNHPLLVAVLEFSPEQPRPEKSLERLEWADAWVVADSRAEAHADDFSGLPAVHYLPQCRDRGRALETALALRPDWILWLTGEEWLEPGGGNFLRSALNSAAGEVCGIWLDTEFLWDSPAQVRVDPAFLRASRTLRCLRANLDPGLLLSLANAPFEPPLENLPGAVQFLPVKIRCGGFQTPARREHQIGEWKKNPAARRHGLDENLLLDSSAALLRPCLDRPETLPAALDLPRYYQFSRPELLPLIPPQSLSILELGCAAGRLGRLIKERQVCRLTGVELNPSAALEAGKYFDDVRVANLDTAPPAFSENEFEVVICADVLEHLQDPWSLLRSIRRWLRPGGVLICSIPNIANLGIINQLAHGTWPYADAGILDRTHLRFFTRSEFEAALKQAELNVNRIFNIPDGQFSEARYPRGQETIDLNFDRISIQKVTPAEFAEFSTVQFVFESHKPAAEMKPEMKTRVSGVLAPPRPVSIVLPVCNQVEVTRLCLESVLKNTPADLFELILVNNGSTDATAELFQSLEGDVQVVSLDKNSGVIEGFNRGAARSASPFLLFLHNDTFVQAGWLEALLRMAERERDLGAIGPKLLALGGKLFSAGSLVFSNGAGWDFGFGEDPNLAAYQQASEVDFCSTACLLTPRRAFEQTGGFDPKFSPAYYDDVDFGFALRRSGYRAWYCPEALAVHVGGHTLNFQASDSLRQSLAAHKQAFLEKWRDELALQEPSPAETRQPPATADRRLRFPKKSVPLEPCLKTA